MRGRIYSKSDKNKVKSMLKQGMSYPTISKTLKIPESTMRGWSMDTDQTISKTESKHKLKLESNEKKPMKPIATGKRKTKTYGKMLKAKVLKSIIRENKSIKQAADENNIPYCTVWEWHRRTKAEAKIATNSSIHRPGKLTLKKKVKVTRVKTTDASQDYHANAETLESQKNPFVTEVHSNFGQNNIDHNLEIQWLKLKNKQLTDVLEFVTENIDVLDRSAMSKLLKRSITEA